MGRVVLFTGKAGVDLFNLREDCESEDCRRCHVSNCVSRVHNNLN